MDIKKNNSRASRFQAAGPVSTLEDIGTQVFPRYLHRGHVLNRRPILRIEQGAAGQPVGDALLIEGTAEKVGDAFGEGDLAAGDLDCATQREYMRLGNVTYIHETLSTRILVDVNKNSGSLDYKSPCTVYNMQTARNRKTQVIAPKRKSTRKARGQEVGPDGRTMPQRLRLLMLDHEPPFNPESGGQSDLARACQVVYANGREHAPATIKQQHIKAILDGQDSSRYLAVIAQVFGVNPLWLQFGIGLKKAPEKAAQK